MSNSTNFNFDFSEDTKPTEVKLQVDALYPSQTPVLRLTPEDDQGTPLNKSTGRALYDKLVAMGDNKFKANFNTTVEFTIKPEEDQPASRSRGDGLVFFMVSDKHPFPSEKGGNLGIFHKNGTAPGAFAVGFDFHTDNPGYINFGIYIESRKPKDQKPIPKEKFLGKNMKLEVSYDSARREITASVSPSPFDGSDPYKVSCYADLSQTLKEKFQIGLGASTSDLVALHDVHTWGFKSGCPCP